MPSMGRGAKRFDELSTTSPEPDGSTAPLVGWDLPEVFATLRRLIEARMAKRGKREFVQVLRLLEVFRPEDVLAGVREAIVRGAIGFDAVKHLPDRAPAAAARPDGLSLPAAGERGDDLGQGLS
jgi:hypothetical protein